MKLLIVSFFISFLLFSCEKSSIKTYHIPKQVINVASLKTNKSLKWEIPYNWQSKEKTQFRLESNSIYDELSDSTSDFSVTKFPDKAGNLLSNINRWRNQLDLIAVNENNIQENLEKINHPTLDITLLKFQSSKKLIKNTYFKSTFVAFFQFNNDTYYVKLTGESNHLNTIINQYYNFLGSISHED